MKCKTHGNHCCAKCTMAELKRGDEESYSLLISLAFALAIFIIGVAIYY